jgi:biotin transport system substrate-specific component
LIWSAIKKRDNPTDPFDVFRKHFHVHSPLLDAAVLTALGLGIMGWLSPQVWMFQGNLPITPQSLLMVLWGVLWGWRVGTATVVLYLLAGGFGAPIFADGASGWIHFRGSTAGFLLAFPIGALVAGWLAEQPSQMRYGTSALTLLLGQLVIVVLGLAWQRGIVPVESTWTDTLLHLLPALLVKTALGSLVVVFVGRALTGHRNRDDQPSD